MVYRVRSPSSSGGLAAEIEEVNQHNKKREFEIAIRFTGTGEPGQNVIARGKYALGG